MCAHMAYMYSSHLVGGRGGEGAHVVHLGCARVRLSVGGLHILLPQARLPLNQAAGMGDGGWGMGSAVPHVSTREGKCCVLATLTAG